MKKPIRMLEKAYQKKKQIDLYSTTSWVHCSYCWICFRLWKLLADWLVGAYLCIARINAGESQVLINAVYLISYLFFICRRILEAAKKANQSGHFLWIGSDSWGSKIAPVQQQEEIAEGAVTILPKRTSIDGRNAHGTTPSFSDNV